MITRLTYQGTPYECRADETVLEALTRQGVNLPFSCRNGICQVCLQRCTYGTIPPRAQSGVRESLRADNYFMPCRCHPEADMVIEPARPEDLYLPALVQTKERAAPDVVRLLLEPGSGFAYWPGQFVNLRRPDGLTRSYSLASLPGDYFLELHVQRKRSGIMSGWIVDELKVGDTVEIQGPQGDNCYHTGNEDQNLLLIGTGTGLAPLIGIAREALASGHSGRIELYHGSCTAGGLYRHAELVALAAQHPNFHYRPCVSGGAARGDYLPGRAHLMALRTPRDLRGWRVHLSGLPQMVYAASEMALAAGALPEHVHADPFEMKDLRGKPRDRIRAVSRLPLAPKPEAGPRPAAPVDTEMWAALREGELLHVILADFYTRVYDDPKLSPFFVGVTKQRLIEKQYMFLRQHFTGEKVYFGDRPRNAHHWMVISDELFDHRESLMRDCLRRHGLAAHLIERLLAFEESFRHDVVKAEPWKKVVGGVELPVDGFGEVALGAGSLCDSCTAEVPAGTTVRYHQRLGTIYCPACMGSNDPDSPAPDGGGGHG